MLNGYIKLWRSMVDWEWYKSPIIKSVFIHLLFLANHEDGRWMGIDIKKGQLATSVESLHQATGISTQQIRTALTKLKSTNEITIKTTNRFTVITIGNWASYQCNTTELTSDLTTNLTNNQQTTNKQLTTNKKDKKNKNEKNTFIDVVTAYSDDLGLQEALLGWVEMRTLKKKGFTVRAFQLALGKLDKLVGDKIQLVDHATEHSWEGFYPIPEYQQSQPKSDPTIKSEQNKKPFTYEGRL